MLHKPNSKLCRKKGKNMKINKLLMLLSVSVTSSIAVATEAKNDKEVVVYSSRKAHLIKPLFEQFTKESGIQVKFQTGDAPALMQKIKTEGAKTPADIFMTVDVGNLWHAANQDIFQPIESKVLEANIPSHLRDPENKWFGLSLRARTVVYNADKVKSSEISTYEGLADKKWEKKLCLRTSKKVYNQSLVAMMIARDGSDKVENTIKGWVGNLAAPVFSSDTNLIKAIEAGQCDIGIVNTYYFGRYQQEKPDTKLKLFWPNQESSGVHMNISGAGLTKHAKSKENAVKLLEWLSSEKAQKEFAGINMEYPVNPKVESVDSVKAWGEFKGDKMDMINAGKYQTTAIKVMDKANYL